MCRTLYLWSTGYKLLFLVEWTSALIAGGLNVAHVRNPASWVTNALHVAVPSQVLLLLSVA